jgi:hypothetical protein
MLNKRSGFAAARRQIYIFSGQAFDWIFDSVQKYKQTTNKLTYEFGCPLNWWSRAATVDNNIYVIGGLISVLVALDVNEISNVKRENDKNDIK